MFKLMMFFVIAGLFILAIYALYKGTRSMFNHAPGETLESLDEYIDRLKDTISDLEKQAKAGIENAEAKLAAYKEWLKKAENHKQKHNL